MSGSDGHQTDAEQIAALRLARRKARAEQRFGRLRQDRVNHRIELAYDGARFMGWQRQPTGRTVEGELVGALRSLLPNLEGLAVGGRTDRGVHASGQVVSFWTFRSLDLDDVAACVDSAAPGEIACLDVRRVSRSFHARFSARTRSYQYIHDDGGVLEPSYLNALVARFVGRHDFFAFSRSTPEGLSTTRVMFEASARREPDHHGRPVIAFRFRADGFIRKQIRVMVATVLREADQGSAPDLISDLLASQDRAATAQPADPSGLILTKIGYDALPSWTSSRRPK